MQDKLLDQTSVSHLFPITKYLGLLATGMTGISRVFFRFTYNFVMVGDGRQPDAYLFIMPNMQHKVVIVNH